MQSIEMFEVITQSDPNDYQSLEILKEAYSKLQREPDVISASKRIAQAYVQSGQLSSAILEYETILQRLPNDPEVLAALAEIESRANSLSGPSQGGETTFVGLESNRGSGVAVGGSKASLELDDGRKSMQKLFVDSKILSVDATDFDVCWPAVDLDPDIREPVEPFISLLQARTKTPMDKALKLISDKTRLAYIPLERYDIDMELSRKFPRDVCRRWCVLPFDSMSKTILVATCNPFNQQAASDLGAAGFGRIVWYLASPTELMKAIKKAFR